MNKIKGEGYTYTELIDESDWVSITMDEFGGVATPRKTFLEAMDVSYSVTMLTWHSRIKTTKLDENEITAYWKGKMNRYNKIRKEVEELL